MISLTVQIFIIFASTVGIYGLYNLVQGIKGHIKIYRQERKRSK